MIRRRQIAFLTGRSDPERCALSPMQREFIAAVRGADDGVVEENFPYFETGAYRAPPLAAASWNNLREYVASRRQAFARGYRPAMERMLGRAEHTWLIAGSCGLELFNNLGLDEDWERRCTLVCLGPVARRRPRWAECHFVQGNRDVLSRSFFPGREGVQRVNCGHLGYLAASEVRAYCGRLLGRLSPCANISA